MFRGIAKLKLLTISAIIVALVFIIIIGCWKWKTYVAKNNMPIKSAQIKWKKYSSVSMNFEYVPTWRIRNVNSYTVLGPQKGNKTVRIEVLFPKEGNQAKDSVEALQNVIAKLDRTSELSPVQTKGRVDRLVLLSKDKLHRKNIYYVQTKDKLFKLTQNSSVMASLPISRLIDTIN